MKLVIFGATGGTGKQVMEQALALGHTVTAVARNPSAITLRNEKLDVIGGDVYEPDTFISRMAGHDAVISSIGVNAPGSTDLYSVGTANIIQAMEKTGINRFICISAAPLWSGPGIPLWQRIIINLVLRRIFRGAYTDSAKMESIVEASELDWTIVRAPRLTNGPHTARYRVGVNSHLSQSGISRADLADYMVTHLNDPCACHARIELAYK